ncbi:hypothetical protein ROA7450_02423 [Roseovarius albus]|uniref:Uncharacterized protein n=1 Tax=Roseovarius albus TaxID=1247867 RepID=A0A1X6ZEL1_9RHOB|nr:hypothetical protein ROA7450_02423 [Roseovarius albus]
MSLIVLLTQLAAIFMTGLIWCFRKTSYWYVEIPVLLSNSSLLGFLFIDVVPDVEYFIFFSSLIGVLCSAAVFVNRRSLS